MYTFIVNPNARSGLGRTLWNDVEYILKEQNIPYQVFFTKYQHHATSLVLGLTADQERRTIIVLGGDGTINEVINGITRLDKVTLGYIPIGSSNDFARGMNLPTDIRAAVRNILTPSRYVHINVGVLSYKDKRRRFAVSAGLGFDAAVCHQVMVSPLKVFLNKLKLGKLSYVGVALHRILTLRPQKMTVVLDDSRTLSFEKVYFATAMNLCFEGGGFKFCPKADCQDDTLDIIVIADISRLKVLALLPTAFFGWHTRFKGIHIFTCKKVEIISEKALPVHVDGEPVFLQKQVEAYLEREKLCFIGTP